MKERIDIFVDDTRLARDAANRARLARTMRREPTDRTPVIVEASFWTILPTRGVSFSAYVANPREHLRERILNHKWRVENIPDDQPIEMECLVLQPDFGALRGTEFPMEIEWGADQPPKTRHLLHAPEQIDALALPDPASGLNAKKIEFYRAMQNYRDEFDVRLNGTPLTIGVTLTQPGGPIPSAFALCGPNLFLWIKTDPDRVHRLLELAARSHAQCLAYFDALTSRDPHHSIWLGADSAEMMSARDFRTFVVPHYNWLWEQYAAPRVFHMCGKINHLLDSIRDDLRVDQLDGFGFPVHRELLAEKWAGRLVMRGGPHPALIHDGPRETIIAECKAYLRTAGKRGGYILCDGFGLMPNTPREHIEAMIESSKRIES